MAQLHDVLHDVEIMSHAFHTEDATAEFGPLLKFERNLALPIHRWVNFKEGFSAELVPRLLTPLLKSRRSLSFLDPFCGVGTSLLAAEQLSRDLSLRKTRIRGIEINPYIHFVAATKMDWHRYNPALMLRLAAVSTNGLRVKHKFAIPPLSTIHNSRFVTSDEVLRLIELREKVRVAAHSCPERRPLLLGVAAASEKVLRLRKDGRALRYTPKVEVPPVDVAALESWALMAEDLQLARRGSHIEYKVLRGDGRRADELLRGESFDVILFSPPYLNNIDYTEVYKVEQWLLGFLRSSEDMVRQRRYTFRSHPSCVFPYFSDAKTAEIFQLLGPPFRRLVDYASSFEGWRRRLFTGYFADILRTLRSCRRLVASGGRIFVVIGNSVHGSSEHPVPVASDLWIAHLAKAADLRVLRIIVGRRLVRRKCGDTVLRESIIEMTST